MFFSSSQSVRIFTLWHCLPFCLPPRSSCSPEGSCLLMDLPSLGSRRPLGFWLRSESCKLISEPNPCSHSLPLHHHLAVSFFILSFLAFGLQCFFATISAHWPHWHLAQKCIPLRLRWLYFQWGFYWDRTLYPELGCAPAGLGEKKDHFHKIVRLVTTWSADMRAEVSTPNSGTCP